MNNLPKGWHKKSMAEAIKYEGGSQPPSKYFIYKPMEGYVRLVQVRDYKTDKYATYIPVSMSKRNVTKEDIMVGRYGPPIFGIFRGLEGSYNVALMKAVPREGYFREFCYYYLQSDFVQEAVTTASLRSAGQTGVNLDFFNSYECNFPPIDEQKKIAEILTSVDKVIELTEIEIEKLKNLKKGMMQDLLTKGIGHTKFKDSPIGKIPESWESKTIKDVTILITKGATPTTYGHDFISYGIKFYRGTNATIDGRASLTDLKFISEEAHEMLKRSSLVENDFVISIVGAPGETSFLVTKDLLPGNINQNVAIVRCDTSKVDPVFIKNWFQGDFFKAQKDIEVTTQAQPSLSLGQIGAFKLYLPPLSEQIKIANLCQSIERTIESKELKLKNIQNIKKGLMQDLLTGKVRVKI